MKKIIILSLVISMLLCSLVSCKNDAGEETQAESQTTVDTSEDNGWVNIYHDVPDSVTYPNEDFTILVREEEPYCYEFNVFEPSSVILNNAVFSRNLALKEELGINLIVDTALGNFPNNNSFNLLVNTSVSSGDRAWNAVAGYAYGVMSEVVKGTFYNLTDVEYLDLSKEYWNQSFVEQFTVNGKLFALTGDISPQLIGQSVVFFENLQVASEYKIESVYELVNNGQWTHEKLLELCKAVYNDNNGDGVRDKNDTYGMICPLNAQIDAFQASYSLPLTTRTDTGSVKFTMKQDRLVDVYTAVYELVLRTDQVWAASDYEDDIGSDYLKNFIDGRALFTANRLYTVSTELTNMEDDFAILPYPKFNSEQKNYQTYAWDQYSIVLIPKDVQNTSFSGAVLEVMASLSQNIVTPAYYETALKYRYSPNSESSQMLDVITKNIHIEFAYLASQTGAVYFVRNQIKTGKNMVAAAYAGNFSKFEAAIDEYISEYSKN